MPHAIQLLLYSGELLVILKKRQVMESIRIDILNPKAKSLLKDLADLKLIRINKEKGKSELIQLLDKLRISSEDSISLEDITNEVESVRKSRYEK